MDATVITGPAGNSVAIVTPDDSPAEEELTIIEEVVEDVKEEIVQEVKEEIVEEIIEEIVAPEPEPLPAVEDVLLLDYVDLDGDSVGPHHVDSDVHFVDQLEVVEDPFIKGSKISVDGELCEKAVGHDGHYDEDTGLWMLDDDMDYEPEWRCLMRPLLREAVKGVNAAELSVESKSILEEKRALIEVHQRLVEEAEKEHEKKSCIELIERKMSRYQECELEVLRAYVQVAESYPVSWEEFLVQKKECVNKFADQVKECSLMFLHTEGYDSYLYE